VARPQRLGLVLGKISRRGHGKRQKLQVRQRCPNGQVSNWKVAAGVEAGSNGEEHEDESLEGKGELRLIKNKKRHRLTQTAEQIGPVMGGQHHLDRTGRGLRFREDKATFEAKKYCDVIPAFPKIR